MDRRGASLLVEVLLHYVQLLKEFGVAFGGLLLDAPTDGFPLGHGLESLKELHAGLEGGHAVEGQHDDVRHHDLEVLHPALEDVVIVVPLGRRDVEDAIVQRPEPGDKLLERHLDVQDALGDLGAPGAPESGHLGLRGELQLGLAHLEHVAAALHEGVRVCKDGRDVKVPRPRGTSLDSRGRGLVHALPSLARANALP